MAHLVFIGDVHGKFDLLLGVLREYQTADRIYQLGDFGIGFPGYLVPPNLPPNFKFIRGNHDNPEEARDHPNYLGDYGIDEYGVGYLSGAWSIDTHARVPGRDWWAGEQLHYRELDKAVTMLAEAKPRIMISHCTTSEFEEILVPYRRYGSLTTDGLDALNSTHQPEWWLCGHYHYSQETSIGIVRYKCLSELEVIELETDDGIRAIY